MASAPKQISKDFRVRAGTPRVLRYVALGVIAITVITVGVTLYRSRSDVGFRLKSEHTQLSTDVVAEVNGYERLETDGNLPKYFVKADFARTFSDNHQELENAYVRIYDDAGNPADELSAQQVLYVPEAEKNFTAYMKDDARILSRDGLSVKTDNITYTKRTELAEAEGPLQFEWQNVRGKATGAVVDLGQKKLDLLADVEIETFESPELVKSGVRYAKVNSSTASYSQNGDKIDLVGNVTVNIQGRNKSTGNSQVTDVASQRATLIFEKPDQGAEGDDAVSQRTQLKKLELFDEVNIVSAEQSKPSTKITSQYALYDKASDFFELRNFVHIVTSANDKPTDVRAGYASYSESALKMNLSGGAEITQASDYVKGDAIYADLFPDKKIRLARAIGNALVRQTTPERTTSITAPEVNAVWNDSRELASTNAVGQSNARIEPVDKSSYTLVTLSAPQAIRATFKGTGLLAQIDTEGRTTIQMNAPSNAANAANKRVTADKVVTLFHANGKDLKRAEAVGNGELYVEPLNAAPQNYRTTVSAPRFDCDFFESGNNARLCVAGKKTKTTRQPTVPAINRRDQILTADQLTATFSQTSSDIERLDAVGNSKFTEGERNAISAQMTFTQADEFVRLRGGTPTGWDGASRAKATEIDWDTKANKSFLRGDVSTTYYSARTASGATPFSKSDKPVFVTSDTAEFDHLGETALFSGNARGWQDDNYVRGDKLHLSQKDGRFDADGNVQSLLYDVKQKGKAAATPVSAAANSMRYSRDLRLLQYRENVDIRQGTDRITAGTADVYLDENNEVSKTIAERSVIITQPGRKGTGDWVQYTSSDEVAILRGKPASVTDAEQGSSQSNEIAVYMRENRFVGSSNNASVKSAPAGRTRSVYKVKGKP